MPAETSLSHPIGDPDHSRLRGRWIARLAAGQHGVISRAQLIESGLGRGGIHRLVDRGRLHSVHPGVYAVGHTALSLRGRWMAAVLAAGPEAVLSHRSAAALWGVLSPSAAPVEVTAPGQHRIPAVIAHRRRLLRDEITVREAIPVTSISRTLFDLAAVVSPAKVEQAMNEAEVLRLTDPLSLDGLVLRCRGRRGVAIVRSILEQGRIGLEVTRSELETRFLGFLDDSHLPRPLTNARLQLPSGWIECDCVWRTQRLIVELDGHAFHRTPAAYERDRLRDRELHTADWTVVRVTWQQLVRDAESLRRDLRRLLEDRPAAPRVQ